MLAKDRKHNSLFFVRKSYKEGYYNEGYEENKNFSGASKRTVRAGNPNYSKRTYTSLLEPLGGKGSLVSVVAS